MRNQKGVTLIALIVTIIVLIIIAGISIASLTGNNGILRQVDTARVATMEGEAKEQVDLACNAFRIAMAQEQAIDSKYDAKNKAGTLQNALKDALNNDPGTLEKSWKIGTAVADGDTDVTSFTVVYDGNDYKNVCENDDAKMTFTITVGTTSLARSGFTGYNTDLSINGISTNDIGGNTSR